MALKLFRRKSKAAVVTEPEKAVAEVKKIVEVRLFVTKGVLIFQTWYIVGIKNIQCIMASRSNWRWKVHD